MTNTQDTLATFIRSFDLTKSDIVARQRGRDAVLDCLAAGIAGSLEPLANTLMMLFESFGDLRDSGGSLLIGTTRRLNAPNAALYNGSLMHALDFDDIAHPSKAHLSASVVAAAMSVMPDDQILSDAFLTAYIVGYEVSAKIGNVLLRRRRKPGWHMTGVLGTFGAAAAAAKIADLDFEQIKNALGFAASCSAGLHINLGSMTKPIHAGRAAQAGVIAAKLASLGITASEEVFDAPMGFFRTLITSESENIDEIVQKNLDTLGNPLELCTELGIALKPYPSCAATHCAIEAAEKLSGDFKADDIDEIYIGISEVSSDPLVHHRPNTGLQAKFSVEFCVVAALLGEPVSIATFQDEHVLDPEIQALINKTRVAIDDRVRDNEEHATVVRLTLHSGDSREVMVELAKGKPSRWFNESDLRAKFEGCAKLAFGDRRASALYDALTDTGETSRNEAARLLTGR